MGDLGDLLELMHTAPERSRSVRLTVREWNHLARAAAAFERWTRASQGRAQALFGHTGGHPEESTTTYRLWWEGPGRFREQIGAPDPRHELVRDGERWWAASPDWGVVSSESEGGGPQQSALAHLVEPGRLLGALRLEPAGSRNVAGRDALTAAGTPRPGDDGAGLVIHRLGAGAESIELAIDAERGIALHIAALFDREPFHSFEVTDIAFDETFPAETFVYSGQAGDVPTPWRPEHLRLDEAARRAPFTLLAPARVPERWRLHVTWMDGRERPPMVPTAHLLYESEDGAYTVQLRQHATGAPSEEWLPYESRGDVEVADAGENVTPRHYVRTEQLGTRVELSGDDAELLLALAAELARAPTEPPRLG